LVVDTKKIEEITPEILFENGLARKNDLVKILGRGDLKSKVSFKVHGCSASALKAIESAGGAVEIIK